MNYFLVTSAIQTPYSCTSPGTRFSQTLDTIRSIYRYCESSRVVIVEVGPQPLDHEQRQALLAETFAVLDLTNDDTVKSFHQCGGDQSYGWVKTPGELYALAAVMVSQTFVTDQDRVFKISGRYQLTSAFDLSQHQWPGKLCVSRRRSAVQYVDPQGKDHAKVSEYQYSTRLYSFCGSLCSVMQEKYSTMLNSVISYYGQQRFVDVEHMMYLTCNELDPIELDTLGITGQQAQDGLWIQE